MPDDIYLDDETYHRLVAALLDVPPCPVTGEPADYEVHRILGEIGGVWPASIENDVRNVS